MEGDEARHLSKVLRAKVGDRFMAFDGMGHEAAGEITGIQRHHILFNALNTPQAIDRRPKRDIRVALVFPKARSRGIIMEKLVELGTRHIQPLLSQRGVDAPDTQRLLTQAITACKQCGINNLPTISAALTLKDFITSKPINPVLLQPTGNTATPEADPITLVIGPEGGFSPEELTLIPYDYWSLGKQVLRSETACLAAVARLGI